jgi:hypothetical protein
MKTPIQASSFDIKLSKDDIKAILKEIFKPEHAQAVNTLLSAVSLVKGQDIQDNIIAAFLKEANSISNNLNYCPKDKIWCNADILNLSYRLDERATEEQNLGLSRDGYPFMLKGEIIKVTAYDVYPYLIEYSYAEGKELKKKTESYSEAAIESLIEEFPGD